MRELDALKSQVVASLSKKADHALLDTLRDTLKHKVDNELMNQLMQK